MKRIRETGWGAFRIDAPLPESGPKRYLLIAWLVLGGLVALFVPVVLALMIWGMVTGQDRPAPEPQAPRPPVSDGAR